MLQVRVNDADARNDGQEDLEFGEMEDARRDGADWRDGPASAADRLRRPRNATSCMALTNNGLLEMRGGLGDDECGQSLRSPACEYRCKYRLIFILSRICPCVFLKFFHLYSSVYHTNVICSQS